MDLDFIVIPKLLEGQVLPTSLQFDASQVTVQGPGLHFMVSSGFKAKLQLFGGKMAPVSRTSHVTSRYLVPMPHEAEHCRVQFE